MDTIVAAQKDKMKPQLRFAVHPYRVWIHRIQTTPRHFEEFNDYRFLSNIALARDCIEQNKCGQIEHFSGGEWKPV